MPFIDLKISLSLVMSSLFIFFQDKVWISYFPKSTKYGALNIKAKVRGGREISRVIVGDVLVKGKALIDELGIARHMAQIYAETPAAQKRGYNTDIFSLDKPGGRCPTCEGRGFLQYDMQFLEDVKYKCEDCNGSGVKQIYATIDDRRWHH